MLLLCMMNDVIVYDVMLLCMMNDGDIDIDVYDELCYCV